MQLFSSGNMKEQNEGYSISLLERTEIHHLRGMQSFIRFIWITVINLCHLIELVEYQNSKREEVCCRNLWAAETNIKKKTEPLEQKKKKWEKVRNRSCFNILSCCQNVWYVQATGSSLIVESIVNNYACAPATLNNKLKARSHLHTELTRSSMRFEWWTLSRFISPLL